MKKWMVGLVGVAMLTGCGLTNPQTELGATLSSMQAEIDSLHSEVTALQTEVESLAPSLVDRYITAVVQAMLLSADGYAFTSIGETVTGYVDNYGYGYIVLELMQATTFDIVINDAAPSGGWNLNVYGELSFAQDTPDFTFEEIAVSATYTVTMPAGFVTIEFDSYVDTHNYSVTLNPHN